MLQRSKAVRIGPEAYQRLCALAEAGRRTLSATVEMLIEGASSPEAPAGVGSDLAVPATGDRRGRAGREAAGRPVATVRPVARQSASVVVVEAEGDLTRGDPVAFSDPLSADGGSDAASAVVEDRRAAQSRRDGRSAGAAGVSDRIPHGVAARGGVASVTSDPARCGTCGHPAAAHQDLTGRCGFGTGCAVGCRRFVAAAGGEMF